MKNLLNIYKKKKIIVTGATGFKGAWLSFWLYMLGAKVYAIGYLPNENKKLFHSLNLHKKTTLKILDITDFNKIKAYVNKVKPEFIFHLAAQPLILEGYKKPYETYKTNAIGTLNILEITRKSKFVKSLICVTSDKCYESNLSTKGFKETDRLGGIDPYSGSKASAEIMIKTYIESFQKNLETLGVASVRAGNVMGGGDQSPNRLIVDIVKSLNKRKKIVLRNPKFNRPWQHVLDPLYGYLILASNLYKYPKKFSGAWNFGTETKKEEHTEIEKQIISILELKIRPAVAKDGGDIKFKEFKDGIVKVELQGSCSGCPSSTMTLKQGVQNLLCHYLPEVKEVVAV